MLAMILMHVPMASGVVCSTCKDTIGGCKVHARGMAHESSFSSLALGPRPADDWVISRRFTWAVGPLRVREKDFLHFNLSAATVSAV